MNPLVTTGTTARTPASGGCALSVNLNKIALLRNARTLGIPSVLRAATLALEAGAHGITVHPRPDERHIRRTDVLDLSELLADWPQAEYNIEGNPLHNLMPLVRELADRGRPPQQVTFVPDTAAQSTSDHGWQLPQDGLLLAPMINEVHSLGVRASLFMDPLSQAMPAARALGADRVELYTERYARAHRTPDGLPVLEAYVQSADAARQAGLAVNAGHDLNLDNLADFLRAVPGVGEVSIGHALIADAIELGLGDAVRAYLRCIHTARAVPDAVVGGTASVPASVPHGYA